MKIKKIFKNIPAAQIRGSREIEITGICANSRLVAPGNLFIAKKGLTSDGSQYIDQAVAAGASAILTDIFDPSLKNVTQVIHPNVTAIEGEVAAQYYQLPSEQLFMVGVTGTNGKTTTTFLIKHLLDGMKEMCGLIGTIEYVTGANRYQASRTTPEVTVNQKMLREMVLNGCKAAVMEVSSHALDQNRVDSIDYDVAVFSNLTLDHLDYHQTMEEYGRAKQRLFTSLGKQISKKPYVKTAVVNCDSPWHRQMIEGCSAKVITYGIDSQADLRACDLSLSSSKTQFNLCYQGKSIPFCTSLIGRFNVYNILAAVAVGLSREFSLEQIAQVMQTARSVRGRLESVPNRLGLNIYVDYAHSDDALQNVLECLREVCKGRVITVFGCGGDRDRQKRPLMAKVVERFSDLAIVTSDNPRTEEPEAIIQEIVSGFQKPHSYEVIVDRREAIERAISLATTQDIVLLAGKGHETYQIFAHKTIEFDDSKVATEICEKRKAASHAHKKVRA